MNRRLVLTGVTLCTCLVCAAKAQEDQNVPPVSSRSIAGAPPCKISGILWNDLNGNSRRDTAEPGISGWTVRLNTGQTAITGPDGRYDFANLSPGQYRVYEDGEPAWFQTFPQETAQSAYPLAWAREFQGTADSSSECLCLEADPNGDILCGGQFTGSIDFDPSAALDMRTSNGGQDAFVARLHADGSQVWVRTLGGPLDDTFSDLKIHPSGDIVVAGSLQFDADLDPTAGIDRHSVLGMRDAFITRLHADGSYAWSQVIGGRDATVLIRSMALDASGNILLTGNFSGSVDFNPGPGIDLHTTPGYASAFVTKLNADGSYGWTRTMGGLSYARGRKVQADASGTIYVAGDFLSTVDFGVPTRPDLRSSNGDCDIFVTAIDPRGTSLWTHVIGGADWDRPHDLCLDASNYIYLAGVYSLWVDFNPADAFDWRYTPNYHVGQCFVTKLCRNGDYVWTVTIGDDTVRTAGMALRVDPADQIWLAGERAPSDCLDGNASRSDLFLAGLSPEGHVTSMRQWSSVVDTVVNSPGTGAAVLSPWSWGLALTPCGDILLSGRFNGAVTWANTNTVGAGTVTSTGLVDGFVTKLARSRGSYAVILQAGTSALGLDFGNVQP